MYWERDQEVMLMVTVLEALDPAEDAGKADTIICGLIDMGLVDCEKAPVAQQQWQDLWWGRDVTHEFVNQWYVTNTDDYDDED